MVNSKLLATPSTPRLAETYNEFIKEENKMVKTSKRTPDRKVSQGGIVGAIVGIISTVFMTVFHKNLDPVVIAGLPTLLGLLGHFFGSYLAPYEPRIEEIIAYVKKLVNEIPTA